ncbi:8163_t:CDS:2 [Racocetra fulgida]|uniref:8163_t:CDS:1 n=1 Tax=Racocetra fulgida TaxID=60492 RepID=A0A9N9CVT2_9GLOM|nr:8163_t:CDS:2 [Racocetra fulgida]
MSTGFNNIYVCYDLGVARLQEILRQDVYKIENNNVNARQLDKQTGPKHQHRVTNDNEKKILEDLLKYDTFPEDKATEILKQLQEQSND